MYTLWLLKMCRCDLNVHWTKSKSNYAKEKCRDKYMSKVRPVSIIFWAVTLLCLINYISHWLFKSVHPLWHLCEWALRHRALNTNRTFRKKMMNIILFVFFWHLSHHLSNQVKDNYLHVFVVRFCFSICLHNVLCGKYDRFFWSQGLKSQGLWGFEFICTP